MDAKTRRNVNPRVLLTVPTYCKVPQLESAANKSGNRPLFLHSWFISKPPLWLCYASTGRNMVVILMNTCVCVCVWVRVCLLSYTCRTNNTPKIQAQHLRGNRGRPTWLQVLNEPRVSAYNDVSPHVELVFVYLCLCVCVYGGWFTLRLLR